MTSSHPIGSNHLASPSMDRVSYERDSSADLISEHYVQKVMPSILGQWDMTCTFIVSIYLITGSTTAAAVGPAAITYLLIGGIFFFLPSLVATAQLGVIYPNEGALYIWTHKAIGGFWSFFAGFCSWFPSVLISTSFAGLLVTYINSMNSSWLVEPWQQGLVIMGVLLFCCVLSLQRFRTVQNVINALVGLTIFASFIFVVAAVVYLLNGHPSATSFVHSSDWQLAPTNYYLYGLMAFAYIGAEGALNLAGEMKEGQERAIVRRHLRLGAALIAVMYLINTFAVLIVLGPVKGAVPFAMVSMVDLALGKFWGAITSICLMGSFVATTLVYNYVFARLLMVAGIDGRIPLSFGKLNRYRVPGNAIVFQTVISLFYIFIAYILVPTFSFIGVSAADLSIDVYNVSQAAAALVWAVSAAFLYINLVGCIRRRQQLLGQWRIFSWPVLWVSVIVGIASCVLAIVDTLLFPWIVQISNAQWWLIVGGVTVIFLVIAVIGAMLAHSVAVWEQTNVDN